jgi:diguanylate cyclase (GGDEF)-like protein/PAS domain S-box-containing protein
VEGPTPQLEEALGVLALELRARREAETALRRSEAQFRSLVERLLDLVLAVDRDGAIQYASPAVAATLGISPQDLIGRSMPEMLHGDDVAAFRESVVEALDGPGMAAPRTVRVRHRDGSWHYLELLGNRLVDLTGQPAALMAARDVTERRRKEEVLRESEERYALALRAAGDGVWDWDLVNERVHYSPAWKTMLGYSDSEIGDRPSEWLGRLHVEDAERVRQDLQTHLEGRSSRLETEHRLLCRDGSYRWVLNRARVLRDAAGRAVRLVGLQTDVADRKASEELLMHQAIHDPLTGLPNRAAFLDRVERSLGRVRRAKGYAFGVLFMDVDRFKLVNDSLGHLSGDQLLVSLGRRLTTCVRPGDMVAHVGSDEFAILVDRVTRPADVTVVAGRIQHEMLAPFSLGGQEVFAGVSIGIALSRPDYERPEDILRDADTAMYRAKVRGTGRVEIFDPTMQARALARLKLETDLRRALERQELRLHYQPIVSLETGSITGLEALVRWQHPERGLVGPSEFIPVAEETGLIIPLCSWVVREACRRATSWHRKFPGRPLSISMNLTSTHFTEPEVMRGISAALAETGMQGHDLALEITESVMMSEFDDVVPVLLQLKEQGIGLHIDDFGTGYCSLSYLHKLPTDALKIDRSFVGRIGSGPGDDVIVRTIVEMAHTLGRFVIAEGIETPEQLERLRSLGCEYGQGFHFAAPMDEAAAEAMLAAEPRW